jgi:hypothetical protein
VSCTYDTNLHLVLPTSGLSGTPDVHNDQLAIEILSLATIIREG